MILVTNIKKKNRYFPTTSRKYRIELKNFKGNVSSFNELKFYTYRSIFIQIETMAFNKNKKSVK